MSDVAIRVDGARQALPRSGDATAVRHAARQSSPTRHERRRGRLRGRRDDAAATSDDWFWALRDVSFEVAHGEVVGIIGRNGAGKSTLLKILSRITEPTRGRRRHRAAASAALLEVGTGFHPELTGRENIYLNGAILGMRRARDPPQVRRDRRLRRGRAVPRHAGQALLERHVRAAGFAVAAHLEPEILVVDEVLAVGDAAFQKKCLGKMDDVGARRAHGAVRQPQHGGRREPVQPRDLARAGRCVADGRAGATSSSRYLSTSFIGMNERIWADPDEAPGNDRSASAARGATGGGAERPTRSTSTTPFEIEFEYWNLRERRRLNLSLHVYNEHGVMVFNALPDARAHWQGRPFPRGLFRDVCHIPGSAQ